MGAWAVLGWLQSLHALVAESKELKALEEVVDTIWKQRLEGGDPFEADLGKERVGVDVIYVALRLIRPLQ